MRKSERRENAMFNDHDQQMLYVILYILNSGSYFNNILTNTRLLVYVYHSLIRYLYKITYLKKVFHTLNLFIYKNCH